METKTQITNCGNAVRVNKHTLILEVKDAIINECGTDFLQQFNDNLQLAQRHFQKQHQQTRDGFISIQSKLRDYKEFQSGVSNQLGQLEDRMNTMDVDLVCVQRDAKGRYFKDIKA